MFLLKFCSLDLNSGGPHLVRIQNLRIPWYSTILLQKWAKKGLWKSSEIDDKPNHIFFLLIFTKLRFLKIKKQVIVRFTLTCLLSYLSQLNFMANI